MELRKLNKPSLLDSIELSIDDIKIHVYGVLHGITGGTNAEYRNAVNNTIANATGVKYCEKSMKSMYLGLDVDVNDWLAFRDIDAFKFSFCSVSKPSFLFHLVKTAVKEKLALKSRFGKNNVFSLGDIGGDLRFHSISPDVRRILAGFPDAEDYMRLNNLRRKKNVNHKINFADPDWKWLTYIEPNANIPYRSIHMIEFVIAHAKKNNIKEASLFVGEIHNSDINWYVKNRENLPDWLSEDAEKIKEKAVNIIKKPSKLLFYKIKYFLTLMAGVAIPLYLYLFLYYCLR